MFSKFSCMFNNHMKMKQLNFSMFIFTFIKFFINRVCKKYNMQHEFVTFYINISKISLHFMILHHVKAFGDFQLYHDKDGYVHFNIYRNEKWHEY